MKDFVLMIGFGKERFELVGAAGITGNFFHSNILSGKAGILLIEILLYDSLPPETHERT
ncbi:hypothetical protein LEP1GSC193_0112 [Leptospira alstonii serovar Pingchang str. 80-412]|uniref:Uncharacterized protein n=2 Tax=Leptospira alstonii TaxID=28452 RepID=M6CXP2_9LEPT|nr:hypothetical protein LEP1GSC194_1609 [Leptospira alstonii serovar Sichuan str. 79601]EQA79116.1 hypothetical protein LEP1GSC193_0112 [Leptospira alstonii serovar Pingchang str. 80-412]